MHKADPKPFEDLEAKLPEDLHGILEKGRDAVRNYQRYLDLAKAPKNNGKDYKNYFREDSAFRASR